MDFSGQMGRKVQNFNFKPYLKNYTFWGISDAIFGFLGSENLPVQIFKLISCFNQKLCSKIGRSKCRPGTPEPKNAQISKCRKN